MIQILNPGGIPPVQQSYEAKVPEQARMVLKQCIDRLVAIDDFDTVSELMAAATGYAEALLMVKNNFGTKNDRFLIADSAKTRLLEVLGAPNIAGNQANLLLIKFGAKVNTSSPFRET